MGVAGGTSARVHREREVVTPKLCGGWRRIAKGKSERCARPATSVVVDYFVVAKKGHRDLPVCDECGARHAGFPNNMTVRPLKKGKRS